MRKEKANHFSQPTSLRALLLTDVSRNMNIRFFIRLACITACGGSIMFLVMQGLMTMPLFYADHTGKTKLHEFYHWLSKYCPDYLTQFIITAMLWAIGFSIFTALFNYLGSWRALEDDLKRLKDKIQTNLQKKG